MAKTKVELQNYQGESLSPITIASNVLYEDGRNAQEVFEEYSNETFTPTIENSSSMFKVGQGDSVDYSGNIVNGAYESMVLKGKSMVNYIHEPSSEDVVLPYEFEEGRYVTINDTKESGALGVELKGQTLVNSILSIDKTLPYTWASNNITSRTCALRGAFKTGVYALIVEFGEVLLGGVQSSQGVSSGIQVNYTDGTSNLYTRSGLENYSKKRFFTTFTINKEVTSIQFKGTAAQYENVTTEGYVPPTVTINKIMILEYQEGMENWDIPYFEGMASCKMSILHSCQQLFDYNAVTKPSASGDIGFVKNESSIKVSFNNTKRDVHQNTSILIPAGTYEVSYMIRGELSSLPADAIVSNSKVGLAFEPNHSWSSNSAKRLEVSYATLSDTEFTKKEATLTFSESQKVTIFYHGWNNNPVGWCEFKDIRITQQGKSSILSLPEEVVLRSLPNGVCDTFNTRTGECVKRIGEIVFDGSQNKANWGTANYENENFIQFYWADTLVAKNNSGDGIKVNCDRFPVYSPNSLISPNPQKIGVSSRRNNSQGIVFSLTKTDMPSFSGESVNSYFAQNPTIICYELATPIVTKINLSSTLKSWNTTTHIYSEIPENSLYPILSHSNPSYPVILKPSTKYSIVANSYSNNHTNSTINFNLGGATASTVVGNRVTTITTPSTLSNELLTMSGRGNKLNHVMVIEGDVVGDEPYFEGICDSKSPILSNVGKNLLPTELSRSFKHITGNQVVSSIDLTSFLNRGVQYVIKLAIPKNVKIAKHYSSNSADDESVLVSHGAINSNNTIARFTIPSNSNSYYLFVNESGQSSSDYISDISELVTIELDTGNIPTEIKPYKSNITTFDQKDDKTIVLRSLPNGVCDTLNVETGEYVQRIGEITLNGSETNWSVTNQAGWESTPNTIAFGLVFTPKALTYASNAISSVVCDKFSAITANGTWAADKEGVSINQHSRFDIRIERTKLPDESLTGFKQWLLQNPITVQYELETPIVSTVDIQGFPYAYTNGHVQLSSGHNAQSLTPKVEYSVATNRNGQIRSNQKMVERHQKQLDQLQAIILANMVNTQYQQTLTTLNYDLLKKEVGE